MSGFEARNICAGYGDAPVLQGLSFAVQKGELLGVLGVNGSGKSTLLKSICGILPHEGECALDGLALEGLSARQIARMCSYIPQRSGIGIDISVLDVVLMGFNPFLHILQHPDSAMQEKAREALELAGLGGKESENYQHLSEGQKQLCILARTLAAQSRLLLLDEPESALDFRYRYRMLRIIRRWLQENGRLAIVTLHDPSLALNYCDELLLLKNGCSAGTIRPKEDALGKMEELLGSVYGPVSLTNCVDRVGRRHIVMLNEQEDAP